MTSGLKCITCTHVSAIGQSETTQGPPSREQVTQRTHALHSVGGWPALSADSS